VFEKASLAGIQALVRVLLRNPIREDTSARFALRTTNASAVNVDRSDKTNRNIARSQPISWNQITCKCAAPAWSPAAVTTTSSLVYILWNIITNFKQVLWNLKLYRKVDRLRDNYLQ